MNDRYENDYIIGILRNMIDDLKTDKPVEQIIDFYSAQLTAFKAGVEMGIMREGVKELVELLKESHEHVCDLCCPSTGKAGVPIKHGDLCERIRQAIKKVEGL